MLKVDRWIFFLFSDRHATEWEFPHYVRIRALYIRYMFSSYVTVTPFNVSRSLCVHYIPKQSKTFKALWI